MEYFANYGDNHMMDGGDWGWGMIMILFWAAVIVLIVVLVTKNLNGNSKASKGESALSIAQQRYAKGEITKKQFDEIKKDLK